jgi:hypothetical protein
VLWQWTLQNFSPFSTGQVQGGFLQAFAGFTSVSSAISGVPPSLSLLKKTPRFYVKSRGESRKQAVPFVTPAQLFSGFF